MNPLIKVGAVWNGLVLVGRLMGWLKPHEATNGLLVGLTAMGFGLGLEAIDKAEEEVFRQHGMPVPGSQKTPRRNMVVLDSETSEKLRFALGGHA